mmetsp:Transcript_8964/g.17144  ORF Transcript_8964/g.17144 Transcript_8964/m.17144 type:complete len:531 (+) Transcript_8964:42-1634(+)
MSKVSTSPNALHGKEADCKIDVMSPKLKITDDYIESDFEYLKNEIRQDGKNITVEPKKFRYRFRTSKRVPRVGMMLVGLGGNNGSTVVGGILANQHNITWQTKEEERKANFYGSLTQSTTIYIGSTSDNQEVHVPFRNILPMVSPEQMVVGGWDINKATLDKAMARAHVFDYNLQQKLAPLMQDIKPLPSVYYPDFIAANQEERADNVINTGSKQGDLEHIRKDIRDFKKQNNLDKVVVLWTANTERFTDVRAGLNTTADEVLAAIKNNEDEVSPSNIFAVASILEGCAYINGSPQNTLVPGVVELAERMGVFIGGDDFKSGQTKMKSVLVDFLISAGIKPRSIVSYNHLGNNDGFNLSAPSQFRSKEISKSNVVDDMVAANKILYAEGEHPDHVVVIKYVPFVRDSKRAMDEYTNEIFMGGTNTIVMHNTCEDSLLASPIIIDLVILTELMQRITFQTGDSDEWQTFDSALSVLSFLLKAPLASPGTPVMNALSKQQRAITNLLCAAAGLHVDSDLRLEYKTALPKASL